MFENLRLQKTTFFGESDISQLYTPDTDSGNALDETADSRIFFRNCSFCLDGYSYSSSNRPLTDFARDNLFYIQLFLFSNCGPHYYTKRKNLDSYLIFYTLEGEGILEYEDKTYRLRTGDGAFIDGRRLHHYRTAGKFWNHVLLHFQGSYSDYIFQKFFENGDVTFHQDINGDFQLQLEKILSLHEAIIPYRELQISTQMEHILMIILCSSANYEQNIQKIPENLKYLVNYINNNYMHPLTLDFLCEFSNISKYYLCRLFKKYLQFTPNEYITQLRLEHAKDLLKSTTLPANKICFMVGISDENYFYRLFKKRVGISPHKYRNNFSS